VHAIGRALFGTVVRRLAALLTAVSTYYLLAQVITHYIDASCTSAGLSLLLIVTWFVLGIATAFVTAVALSDLLIGQAFLDDFEALGFENVTYADRSSTPWKVVEGIEFRAVTLVGVLPGGARSCC